MQKTMGMTVEGTVVARGPIGSVVAGEGIPCSCRRRRGFVDGERLRRHQHQIRIEGIRSRGVRRKWLGGNRFSPVTARAHRVDEEFTGAHLHSALHWLTVAARKSARGSQN